MERGINGICSQFCLDAPHGFRQFCGAGKVYFLRGGAACFSAGRGGAGRPSLIETPLLSCDKRASQMQSSSSYASVSGRVFGYWDVSWAVSECVSEGVSGALSESPKPLWAKLLGTQFVMK